MHGYRSGRQFRADHNPPQSGMGMRPAPLAQRDSEMVLGWPGLQDHEITGLHRASSIGKAAALRRGEPLRQVADTPRIAGGQVDRVPGARHCRTEQANAVKARRRNAPLEPERCALQRFGGSSETQRGRHGPGTG